MTKRTNNQMTSPASPIDAAAATPFGAMPMMGFETMLAWNRPMLEAMSELAGRSLEKSAAMSAAWSSLVQKRMESNTALPQRIAACRSPEELLHVYGEWAKLAAAQYQESFDAMSRIGQDMQRETAAVVGDTFNGASHGINRHAA